MVLGGLIGHGLGSGGVELVLVRESKEKVLSGGGFCEETGDLVVERMSCAAKPIFKPLSMANGCLISLPTIFSGKISYSSLSIPFKPIKLQDDKTAIIEEEEVSWENQEVDDTEATISDWEGGGEGEEGVVEAIGDATESGGEDGFVEAEE